MALRDAGTQPLAFLRPAAQAGHVGGRAGLVDEDEFAGIEVELVTHTIALAIPISNWTAARRAGIPPSAASITRSRKSWL